MTVTWTAFCSTFIDVTLHKKIFSTLQENKFLTKVTLSLVKYFVDNGLKFEHYRKLLFI